MTPPASRVARVRRSCRHQPRRDVSWRRGTDMRRDPRVKNWERVRVERRQRAVARLWRLHAERMTRSAGSFHGTRATAYGDVQSGPRFDDHGRALLALVLLLAVVAATLLGLTTAGHDVLGIIRPLPAVRRHMVIICVQRGESMRAVV